MSSSRHANCMSDMTLVMSSVGACRSGGRRKRRNRCFTTAGTSFSRPRCAKTPRSDPAAHPAEDPLEASLGRVGAFMVALGEALDALAGHFGALLQHADGQTRARNGSSGLRSVSGSVPALMLVNFSCIFLRICVTFQAKFSAAPEKLKC